MTRVLLVDDHPVVRNGLKRVLSAPGSDILVDEAGNAEEALERLRGATFDIVVLDITMPGRSGLDLLKQLRKERPELAVLVLSMHPAAQFARRVLSAGASGYLTKDTAPGELAGAIARLRQGKRCLAPAARRRTRRPRPAHEALSDREYQVMRMLASGQQVSQVAQDLSLSVKSVSTYRARVLKKMGMRSNTELMRYALDNNLVD